MIILIAESKTMTTCDGTVNPDDYITRAPRFGQEADRIMESLRGMTAEELSAEIKISMAMIRKLQRMIYEFPDKTHGSNAIEAFTGVVFKALDYKSLDRNDRQTAHGRIRIISSLYGWLRPDDIIKSYRFDFTTPLAPEGKRFAAYWQEKVTASLLDEIRETKSRHILNLLPGDAERAINRDVVEQHAQIWKAEFREVIPGGKTRTPNANKLKKLRGLLLRQIIQENITSPEQLASLTHSRYFCEEFSYETQTATFTTSFD